MSSVCWMRMSSGVWICIVWIQFCYLFDRVDDIVRVDTLVGVIQVDSFFLWWNDGDGGNGFGRVLGVFGNGWNGSEVIGLLLWWIWVLLLIQLIVLFQLIILLLTHLIILLLTHLIILLTHLIILPTHFIALIDHLSLLTHHLIVLLIHHIALRTHLVPFLIHLLTHSFLALISIEILLKSLHPVSLRYASRRLLRLLPLLLLLLHPVLPDPVVAVAFRRSHVGLLHRRVFDHENVGGGRLRFGSLAVKSHRNHYKLLLALLWGNVLPIPPTAKVRRRHFTSIFLAVRSQQSQRSLGVVRSNSIAVESIS